MDKKKLPPAVRDSIDFDALVDEYAKRLGVSNKAQQRVKRHAKPIAAIVLGLLIYLASVVFMLGVWKIGQITGAVDDQTCHPGNRNGNAQHVPSSDIGLDKKRVSHG